MRDVTSSLFLTQGKEVMKATCKWKDENNPDNRTSAGVWNLLGVAACSALFKTSSRVWCWKDGNRNLTTGIKLLKHVKGYAGSTWRKGWLWIEGSLQMLKYGEGRGFNFSVFLLFPRGKERWGRLEKTQTKTERKGEMKTRASFMQN